MCRGLFDIGPSDKVTQIWVLTDQHELWGIWPKHCIFSGPAAHSRNYSISSHHGVIGPNHKYVYLCSKINLYYSCLVGLRWRFYHPSIHNHTNRKPHQPRNILATAILRFYFWKQLSGSISTLSIHFEVFQQQQRRPLTLQKITACNVNLYTSQITQRLYGQSDALYMNAPNFHLEHSQEQAVDSRHYLSQR